MRILAISDQQSPFIYQARFPENFPGVDLILLAGDLRASYVEYITSKVRVPVVYVHGNHREEYSVDDNGNKIPPGGVIPAHGKIVNVCGLRIAGWGGSPKYREGSAGQYNDAEAEIKMVSWFPQMVLNKARTGHGVDILLSHAPPPGENAGEGFAHRGSTALGLFHRMYRPRLHVHGHVHLYEAHPRREYITKEGVRVVNAFEYTLIEL